jgi:hypothetical protein
MNSSPATSQMPATGGRFGVCLLPYPRREISWGERHPLRREACAARGVHFDHAHVIRLAASQPNRTVLCGHTCGGNPALYFSSAKHVARALARQDNKYGAPSVPRLILGDGRLGSPGAFPRFAFFSHAGPAVNNTRADQPGPGGLLSGAQVSQRGSQSSTDVNEGLQPFLTRGPRLGDRSVGGFVVSHDAWKDSVGEFADVQKVFAVGAKNV